MNAGPVVEIVERDCVCELFVDDSKTGPPIRRPFRRKVRRAHVRVPTRDVFGVEPGCVCDDPFFERQIIGLGFGDECDERRAFDAEPIEERAIEAAFARAVAFGKPAVGLQ